MTLDPLLNVRLAIWIHAIPAIAAFLVGGVQFFLPKGTRLHRLMGWTWVVLMTLIALSSFFIHTICTFGDFIWIHLLSILTLGALPFAAHDARQHRVRDHAKAMKDLYIGALVIAGAFKFSPGRIMRDVVFGTATAHSS